MNDMIYERFDYVSLKNRGKKIVGYVVVRDLNGGGICTGIIHSYDIYADIEGTSMKHVPESELSLLAKNGTLAWKALKLAIIKHEKQVDLAGEPYTKHIVTVGENVLQVTGDDKTLAVAFLHDILEDTDVSEDELLKDFPMEVVEAVKIITKDNKTKTYSEYIKSVKENELSRIVKLADLKHNIMLSRFKTFNRKDLLRVKKYIEAMDYLS